MNEIVTAIVLVRSGILLLASGITYIAFNAYRRTGERTLRALGLGFGVITVGTLTTSSANQFFSAPLEIGILVNSIFVAVGFAIITYSLYTQR
ncbi:DUF7521 family protein [Halogeometricum salsisoli]|uniref:DUF7521 family protein n=1 Tax=Halogeometricum salsisoli TaxID=2950536 RepID=UPI003CCDA83F